MSGKSIYAGILQVQRDVKIPKTNDGGRFKYRSAATPRLPRHRGDEGLRLLHGLEANLSTSLQTPQEA